MAFLESIASTIFDWLVLGVLGSFVVGLLVLKPLVMWLDGDGRRWLERRWQRQDERRHPLGTERANREPFL